MMISYIVIMWCCHHMISCFSCIDSQVLRITRHRAGKAVLFQQCAWCVEVLFDWLLIQLSNAKQRKGKQKKANHDKKSFNMSSEIFQNSIEIKLQRGSGELLGALFAPSCVVLGVLGCTWEHLVPKTCKKRQK